MCKAVGGRIMWIGITRRNTAMTTFPLAWCPSMWATAFAASLSG